MPAVGPWGARLFSASPGCRQLANAVIFCSSLDPLGIFKRVTLGRFRLLFRALSPDLSVFVGSLELSEVQYTRVMRAGLVITFVDCYNLRKD